MSELDATWKTCYTPMVMATLVWWIDWISAIPNVLTSPQFSRYLTEDDPTRMGDELGGDWGKIPAKKGMDILPTEHS